MKTLICIPCLLTGGTEIQTLNTVHALVQGRHEVTVACYFEHTPEMVARYRRAGAEVILFSPEGVRVGGYKSILFLYKHLRRAVKAVRPDVAHVQYMAPGATVILLLWLMGVKNIIATAHTAADIYRDLRLIHFLQRRCLRAFTCITERAERSFFGTSQLYSPDLVLGRRNHFTIYNALPAQMRCNVDANCAAELLCSNDNDDDNENCLRYVALNLTQTSQNSQNNISEQDNQRELDTIAQNLQVASPLLASGAHTHLEENTKHSTLNATQENSHTDFNENENCLRYVALNLTQTSQNSQNNISEQDNQRELDTIAQNLQVASPLLASGAQSHLKGNLSSSSLSSSSQKEPSAPFVLGVVSRLEPIKGMDLVVPAFAEVFKAYPETQLLVVGDGSLRASMEEQAAQLGCASHIRFVGRQPQEELSQWYTQMDIVLMPSRSEGFGLTAIEAMAHGCVMVASDVGGLPEVVRDGICGLLHRTEDVADMASKICSLIGDPALYTQLRAQSLVEVEKYSFERYAALMNDLYSKLGR